MAEENKQIINAEKEKFVNKKRERESVFKQESNSFRLNLSFGSSDGELDPNLFAMLDKSNSSPSDSPLDLIIPIPPKKAKRQVDTGLPGNTQTEVHLQPSHKLHPVILYFKSKFKTIKLLPQVWNTIDDILTGVITANSEIEAVVEYYFGYFWPVVADCVFQGLDTSIHANVFARIYTFLENNKSQSPASLFEKSKMFDAKLKQTFLNIAMFKFLSDKCQNSDVEFNSFSESIKNIYSVISGVKKDWRIMRKVVDENFHAMLSIARYFIEKNKETMLQVKLFSAIVHVAEKKDRLCRLISLTERLSLLDKAIKGNCWRACILRVELTKMEDALFPIENFCYGIVLLQREYANKEIQQVGLCIELFKNLFKKLENANDMFVSKKPEKLFLLPADTLLKRSFVFLKNLDVVLDFLLSLNKEEHSWVTQTLSNIHGFLENLESLVRGNKYYAELCKKIAEIQPKAKVLFSLNLNYEITPPDALGVI